MYTSTQVHKYTITQVQQDKVHKKTSTQETSTQINNYNITQVQKTQISKFTRNQKHNYTIS